MTKTIVIVGVTGAQGSSVAHTFLSLPGWKVRGISRNASSPAAQALTAKGVEIIEADVNDKASLFAPFEGANVIFSNTDFFAPFFAALGGESDPAIVAFDIEVAQGLNIAEAASQPVVLQTLEHFIYSSLSDAKKWSGGKFTDVYHFDSKAETIRQMESRFPKLATKMSFLQVGHYITNWKHHPTLGPQKQSDGSFLVARHSSVDEVTPFVVANKDTGPFVHALVEMPPGKSVHCVSEYMTWPEWTALWGEVLGVKAVYKQIGESECLLGAPEPMRKELWAAFAYTAEFGYTGGDPDVLSADQLGKKLELTSMREYIQGEDWSSIL
ncbi:NAD(P)-binding protein [Amniculicola lignicola CBS 123094]|uniref:NAD(P)-binding protein n=1 Tax=Amniculicola lignicola CBS 123094 TaxID=1392246 RepID=A0A6A5WU38_9PLEO|nr:NAD(P)-binding protein [Amniculicola lignicola CBS 123094]